MKKLLFLILITPFLTSGQVLQNQNFNTLTVGNVTTDFTGNTSGQDGYFVQSSNGNASTTTTNASATNATITNIGAANLNTLLLTGPNGNQGATFMWKDGLAAAWASRTSGNDILEVEFDINPQGVSTSENGFGIRVYNSDFTKILVGVAIVASTKNIKLIHYSNPPTDPIGNYYQDLAVTLPANQFSRIGISFNKVTGQVIIKAPGLPESGIIRPGSATGEDPATILFTTTSTTNLAGNTSSATANFDNVVAKASATDTLLGTDEFALSDKKSISIFPNPTNNIINIDSNDNTFKSVTINDINGREVINKKFDEVSETQINIESLAKGIYVIKIDSGNKVIIKKIAKH